MLLQSIFDKLLFEKKVTTQFDFADKLGYTEGYMSAALKKEGVPQKMQKKLNEVFGVSLQYLASNGEEGAMFGEKNDPPPPEKPPRRVPVLGEGLAGTDMELNVTDNPPTEDYIDVGDLLKDSEAAFVVYGNSMTPAYPPGCVLGIKRNYDSFIQPGETYLIVTKSNRLFKRLYYNDDNTGFTCFSDNTMKHETGPMAGKYFYPPFEIEGNDVISVFDVTGMIKRNRNSGIIQRQK